MNRNLAEQLLQELATSTRALETAERIARGIEDETEQMLFRRAIANIVLSVHTDVASGVFAQHPDLQRNAEDKQD